MKKQNLIISSVVVAAILSIATISVLSSLNDEYVYIQSDITKANPNITIGTSEVSMASNIAEFKQYIVLTLSGTIEQVGEPIAWEDETGHKHGSVPVTMIVDKNTKIDKDTKQKIKKGESFTFYLDGTYERGVYYLHNFEPQFEIGEEVIVHIGKAYQGPVGLDGDNYYVELGETGKYKVVEDKAYNEKHKNGKSLDKAFNEAN